jgi:hypothetical protein
MVPAAAPETAAQQSRAQDTRVELVERHMTNAGYEPLEPAHIVSKSALVLVLQHKFGRSLLERTNRPYAKELC